MDTVCIPNTFYNLFDNVLRHLYDGQTRRIHLTVIAAQLITIVYVSREVKRRYKTVIEWLLAVWFAEQVVTLYILTH